MSCPLGFSHLMLYLTPSLVFVGGILCFILDAVLGVCEWNMESSIVSVHDHCLFICFNPPSRRQTILGRYVQSRVSFYHGLDNNFDSLRQVILSSCNLPFWRISTDHEHYLCYIYFCIMYLLVDFSCQKLSCVYWLHLYCPRNGGWWCSSRIFRFLMKYTFNWNNNQFYITMLVQVVSLKMNSFLSSKG